MAESAEYAESSERWEVLADLSAAEADLFIPRVLQTITKLNLRWPKIRDMIFMTLQRFFNANHAHVHTADVLFSDLCYTKT